jgi:hypothetical protein
LQEEVLLAGLSGTGNDSAPDVEAEHEQQRKRVRRDRAPDDQHRKA